MDRERRTRQSNREYQQRIRREQYREEQRDTGYFSVIPKSPEEKKAQASIGERRSPSGQRSSKRRRSPESVSNSGQRRTSSNRERSKVQQAQNKKRRESVGRSLNERPVQKSRPVQEQRQRKSRPVQETRRMKTGSVQSERRSTKERSNQSVGRHPAEKQMFFDYTLIFVVFFLVMFGLLMLYTASIYTSDFFVKQCKVSLLGIVVMFIFARVDYHLYARKWMPAIIAGGAVLSVLMIWSPLGVALNGARRWIGVGPITVQPAEIFKIAIILVNAFLITKFNKNMHKAKVLGFFLFITAFSFLLILVLGQNLSSAIIVAMITVLMVFVACPTYKPFVITGGLGLIVAGIFVYCCLTIDGFAGFRGERIIAWLQPERATDPDMIFQSTQALYSIGSGGLGGKGLGGGTQKMILPEAMNDMIFAIICEEMGMVGAFFVLVMFAMLLYRLMFIAKNSKDLLGGMIATGVFVHFMVQVILNIGVVTGLLPPTGVTLPFISYGGTALILLMAEIGIALNVSRQIDLEHKVVRRRVPARQRS